MPKALFVLLPLLFSTTTLAASVTAPVPVTAATQSACVFDTANSEPTIDLPEYEAALASTYAGEQAQVSISVYCNKGTTLSARALGGSSGATTKQTAVTVPLTLDGTPNSPAINTLVWYTTGGSNTVPSGTFKGAVRYVSVIRAGWPQTPQFSAKTGFYTGSVVFSVDF